MQARLHTHARFCAAAAALLCWRHTHSQHRPKSEYVMVCVELKSLLSKHRFTSCSSHTSVNSQTTNRFQVSVQFVFSSPMMLQVCDGCWNHKIISLGLLLLHLSCCITLVLPSSEMDSTKSAAPSYHLLLLYVNELF